MRASLLLVLAASVAAQDGDEIPPGPLKDLMDGLESGKKEITINVDESELRGIEHALKTDRSNGIERLRKYLAEKKADASDGALVSYNDAVTVARRFGVRSIKDEYVLRAPKERWLLAFELPVGRWRFARGKGGRGRIEQFDRKGALVRRIDLDMYHKRFSYELDGKKFDGSNARMIAKKAYDQARSAVKDPPQRLSVRRTRFNGDIRSAYTFAIDEVDEDGRRARLRAYHFPFAKDRDVSLSVTIREFGDRADPDPEWDAVRATIRPPK